MIRFIHALDLQDPYPCWNLRVSGYLMTPNYAALVEPNLGKAHRAIDGVSVDDLERGIAPTGVVTLRHWNTLQVGLALRAGRKVRQYGEEVLFSEETKARWIRCAEAELAFERGRRRFPLARVSRLSCIWLAERSPAGEVHVREMLGPDVFILKVRIGDAINVVRADSRWYDLYTSEPKAEYVDAYWNGEPAGDKPRWEYLLDGVMVAEDPADLRYLREHGADWTTTC